MRQPFPIETPQTWPKEPAKFLLLRKKRPVRRSDGIVTAFRDGEVTLRENRRTEGFTNAVQEIGYQGVRRGDLVVHGMDGFAGAIGVSDSDGKASPVVHAYVGRPGVDPRFYSYLLRSLANNGFVASLAKGIRQRSTAFDAATLGSLVLPVPDADSQSVIADFLDRETERIDRLVEKKRRLIELLEEKRTALISHAVTKGLDPTVPMKDSGIPWLGDIPAHWEVVRLGSFVASELAGIWGEEPQDGPDDIVCLRVADFDRREAVVSTGKLTMRSVSVDQRLKRRLEPGDILLERSGGGDNQPVGFAVLFDHGFQAVCSNFVSRLRVTSGSDPSYFRYALASAYAKRINTRSIKQTTGIQNLDYRSYMTELWAAPAYAEQVRTAAWLDAKTATIDEANDKAHEQLDLLAEYRQALITAAVTGQIDIAAEHKDPEEVVA